MGVEHAARGRRQTADVDRVVATAAEDRGRSAEGLQR